MRLDEVGEVRIDLMKQKLYLVRPFAAGRDIEIKYAKSSPLGQILYGFLRLVVNDWNSNNDPEWV